jgi:hypothetical protein
VYSCRDGPLYAREREPSNHSAEKPVWRFWTSEKSLDSDEIRTPYCIPHNLFIIPTDKACNFRCGNMFMNAEKVRIGEKKVATCLQATTWHVPDMTGEIQDK